MKQNKPISDKPIGEVNYFKELPSFDKMTQ